MIVSPRATHLPVHVLDDDERGTPPLAAAEEGGLREIPCTFDLGVDVNVILTRRRSVYFVWRIANEIYRVVSE